MRVVRFYQSFCPPPPRRPPPPPPLPPPPPPPPPPPVSPVCTAGPQPGTFPAQCAPLDLKLAKAAGAEPAGQMSDEKLHAVVARSTFRSQNVQSTLVSDHFWKLRCPKSARRCGAEHISKSKWKKHLSSGPLLEVAMSKKCTPLWREAHFEVKMEKNTSAPDHFWKLRCRKSARGCGAEQISKSKCTKHHMFAPLLEVQMSFCVAGARDCALSQK